MRGSPARLFFALPLLLLGCNKAEPRAKPTRAAPSPPAVPIDDADAPLPRLVNRQNPKELGWVHWERDFERATARARAENKPLFLLFQEVPGCSTCVGFGQSVLAHPLLIESIETDFVPIAIHNNKEGDDAKVLARFGEPSWNNPVVRFVDADGQDLIDRQSGVWDTHRIASRMAQSLVAFGRQPPPHLAWVIEETSPDFAEETFSMHCYWAGETCLGDVDGVRSTEAGWLDGREVVVVDFDPARITAEELRAEAKKRGCGQVVAEPRSARPADDRDRKYHLKRSRWRYVPLTPMQAARVNSALGRGQSPERWVSPRQLGLYRALVKLEARQLTGLAPPTEVRRLAGYQEDLLERLSAR